MLPKSNGKMNQNEIWNKHLLWDSPGSNPVRFDKHHWLSTQIRTLPFICSNFFVISFPLVGFIPSWLEERERTTCFAQVYRPNRCPRWIFKNRGPVLLPGVNAHRGRQARIVVPCTNGKTKRPKAHDIKIRKDPTDGEIRTEVEDWKPAEQDEAWTQNGSWKVFFLVQVFSKSWNKIKDGNRQFSPT